MKRIKTYEECTPEEQRTFRDLTTDEYLRHYGMTTENAVMVMTPKPYLVEKRYLSTCDLADLVEGLYAILKVLGISKKVAAEKDYTLNLDTGDRLRQVAIEKGNKPAITLINAQRW